MTRGQVRTNIEGAGQPLRNANESWFVSQKLVMVGAKANQEDLTTLHNLIATGKVTPVIDRRYSLNEVPEAIRYLEMGHARGKVVITL
jgi:NADPH:quinone reductase-like Zn-dependent oxidoreductase